MNKGKSVRKKRWKQREEKKWTHKFWEEGCKGQRGQIRGARKEGETKGRERRWKGRKNTYSLLPSSQRERNWEREEKTKLKKKQSFINVREKIEANKKKIY